MGVWKDGRGSPWILKILAKKDFFLSFEWEKQILPLLPFPRKILEKSLSAPLEKILPTPMTAYLPIVSPT